MSSTPEIAVAVPSHDRPVRLRWLLNALEEQTLDRDRWEVVVAHDSSGLETEQLLQSHPLATEGVLRHVTLPPGSAPPGANRNAAWRAARAPLIAFTDDDCRPPREWLARALDAASASPGSIVQGATVPDPDERAMLSAPHWHTQRIVPPSANAETCNIVYPRELLERVGGFDEHLFVGEDTELCVRAREAGADYVGDGGVVTHHAVVEMALPQHLRSLRRWQGLPELIKRHPQLRDDFVLWIFWKRTHAWLPLAAVGAILGRRRPMLGALAIPYVVHTMPQRGTDPRGRLRALAELPARVAIDLTEMAVLARGSLRARTLFL